MKACNLLPEHFIQPHGVPEGAWSCVFTLVYTYHVILSVSAHALIVKLWPCGGSRASEDSAPRFVRSHGPRCERHA